MMRNVKSGAAPPSAEPAPKMMTPEQHGDSASEQVSEPPADQQEAAEGECVACDDPLASCIREPESLLSGRERDVHDGDVNRDHELRESCRRESPPPPPLSTLRRARLLAWFC